MVLLVIFWCYTYFIRLSIFPSLTNTRYCHLLIDGISLVHFEGKTYTNYYRRLQFLNNI